MNKYKLKMRTLTGLGNEYVYVYATSNFERYLNKHNLKYARDITKDYQLTDRIVKSQQKVNKLETNIDEAIEYIKHSWWLRTDQTYDTSKDLKGWEVEQLLSILERGKE